MQNAIIPINPQLAIQQAKSNYDIVRVLVQDNVLRTGIDYGIVPGTSKKPSLFKPGAERLCAAFSLNPVFEIESKIERWDSDSPLFFYSVRVRLIHIGTGLEVSTGLGSCNSMESKYRFRWIYESDVKKLGLDPNALTKKQNDGKNGSKYWTYRVESEDVFSQVNTILKMACKRALIAAVLIGTNASEFFTQDIEDLRDFGSMDVIEGDFEEITTTTQPTPPPAPATNVTSIDSAKSGGKPSDKATRIIKGAPKDDPVVIDGTAAKKTEPAPDTHPEDGEDVEVLSWDAGQWPVNFISAVRGAIGNNTVQFDQIGAWCGITQNVISKQIWTQKFGENMADAVKAAIAGRDAQAESAR